MHRGRDEFCGKGAARRRGAGRAGHFRFRRTGGPDDLPRSGSSSMSRVLGAAGPIGSDPAGPSPGRLLGGPTGSGLRNALPRPVATQTTLLRPARLPAPPVIQTQLNWGPFRVSVGHEKDARTDRTNAAVTVVFSAPPLRRRELFSRPLTLPTLSTRVPRVEIALKAQVVPEVEITPDPLVLGPDPASGESRFSVRTRQPSRIVRAVGKSAHGAKVVELDQSGQEDSEWGLAHHFLVRNSSLAGARQIDVELEVQRGAGETEARSASAQIERLTERINNE